MTDIIRALAQPAPPRRSIFHWAVVTQADPLRVRIVTEQDPLTVTPRSTIAGLDVDDVVRIEIAPDGDVIVIGRRGGPTFASLDGTASVAQIPNLPASKITSGALDAARRWAGAPRAMDGGRVAVPSGGGNSGTLYWSPSFTITFAVGRFSSAPQVVASPDPGSTTGVGVGADVLAVSASSCTVRVNRWSVAPGPNFYVRWIAVEV